MGWARIIGVLIRRIAKVHFHGKLKSKLDLLICVERPGALLCLYLSKSNGFLAWSKF